MGTRPGKPYDKPAAIQYVGIAGGSQDCVDAVVRLVQCRESITEARILTCPGAQPEHALILTIGVGDLMAVKSGFASGYRGGGPNAFSLVLQILEDHGAEITEYDVSEDLLRRLDASSLTVGDLEALAHRTSPRRLQDYIFERHYEWSCTGALWQQFPPVMPYAIIDRRIMDLARSFWDDPDERLMTAYRRLEDIVRARTGLDEHSARLMSSAFLGAKSVLTWNGCNEGERTGRASLFTGAFHAYRNPRAHRVLKEHINEQLGEFLLVNHLYQLESTAMVRVDLPTDTQATPAPPEA